MIIQNQILIGIVNEYVSWQDRYFKRPIVVAHMNNRFDKKLLSYIRGNEEYMKLFLSEYYKE